MMKWRKAGMKKNHGMLLISPWFEEEMEQKRRTEYRAPFPIILFIKGIILLLAIINPLNTLALGEVIANQEGCDKARITLLLNEIESFEEKSHFETLNTVNKDFSDIARKYILIDCDIAGLMIDLTDVGFELSKKANERTYRDVTDSERKHSLKQPYFFASILLHKDKWFRISDHILQLEIGHEFGRVKSIKAIVIYMYL